MSTHLNLLKKQKDELQKLLLSLNQEKTYLDKLAILNVLPIVQDYLQHPGPIQTFLQGLTPACDYTIKAIIAIGQAPIIFNIQHTKEDRFERLRQLLQQLLQIESFYQHMGGIIGYHLTVITMIIDKEIWTKSELNHIQYIYPTGLHLNQDNLIIPQVTRWGIESVKQIAEIYPVGGAGDRLNLLDEKTNIPLPAALLPFLGRTLLEGLIRDVQAREYLAFKLLNEQSTTPISMMTSLEKNNHSHILEICKNHQWFGRPSSSFRFFNQPMVPVITIEGNWSLSSPLQLTLKPCGHGVLWKLAEEEGIFSWLKSQGRHQCLIRQINNPVAGTDHSILALIGIGCHEHKFFGFVSSERLLNSDEGTNVLIETQDQKGYHYQLTNIEYTDFVQKGIGETPAQPGSPFSIYPANTNILFADISSIQHALKICEIPGQLINMKSKVSYIDPQGQQISIPGGRLESTMQNIADYLTEHFPHRLHPNEYSKLKTFIVYNERSKTISTTKKSYQLGNSPISTPEQTYYDILSNHYTLLQQCQFELPDWRKMEDYLSQGPSCIFLFHPALGPLYSIIRQKVRQGQFKQGAELQLEIAEADIKNLVLDGSLLIEALHPLGINNASGVLQYGKESRCHLHHVTILNKGLNNQVSQTYWKNNLTRKESVKIVLHEGAEFYAENVTLEGNYYFEVPAHHCLILESSSQGQWVKKLFPIQKSSWYWHYTFDTQNHIQLNKLI